MKKKKKFSPVSGKAGRFHLKQREAVAAPDETKSTEKEEKKKFSVSGLFIALGIILALLVSVFAVSFFLFRVDKIDVHSTISAEKVITASGVRVGDSIVTLSKKDIEQKIKSAYPYVTSVSVVTTLPGSVELRLYESTPYFYVKAYDKYLTLTSDLRVLESYSTENAKIAIR